MIQATNELQLFHGITGNMYLVCKDKQKLIGLCHSIQKSSSAVRYVKRYEAYAIRIKSKLHKKRVKGLKLNEFTNIR